MQLVEFSSFAVHGPPGAPGPVCALASFMFSASGWAEDLLQMLVRISRHTFSSHSASLVLPAVFSLERSGVRAPVHGSAALPLRPGSLLVLLERLCAGAAGSLDAVENSSETLRCSG